MVFGYIQGAGGSEAAAQTAFLAMNWTLQESTAGYNEENAVDGPFNIPYNATVIVPYSAPILRVSIAVFKPNGGANFGGFFNYCVEGWKR